MALVFPTNPIDGQLFDRYIYNDAKGVWDIVPDDVFPYYVGPTKPTSPKEGMAWFNTENGNTYMYYDDGEGGTRLNLIPNSGFESPSFMAGWFYHSESPWSISTSEYHSGTSSAYVQDDGMPRRLSYEGILGDFISVSPGLTYTASAYVKQKTTSADTFVSMQWMNGSVEVGARVDGTPLSATSSGWVRPILTATAPAGATSVDVSIWTDKGSYIDSVLVEVANGVGSYIDGGNTVVLPSGQWVATSGTLVVPSSNQIALLDDVTLSSLVDGDVIAYDSTSASWINSNPKNEYVRLNPKTISENLTIPSGYNGTSAGPLTISDGVVVTVADGSAWSVV